MPCGHSVPTLSLSNASRGQSMYIFGRGAPKNTFLARSIGTLYSFSKSCSQGENPNKRGPPRLVNPSWIAALPRHPRHTTCMHNPPAPSLLPPFEFAMPIKVPLCFQVKTSTIRGAACSSTAQTVGGRTGFPLQSSRGETSEQGRAGALPSLIMSRVYI